MSQFFQTDTGLRYKRSDRESPRAKTITEIRNDVVIVWEWCWTRERRGGPYKFWHYYRQRAEGSRNGHTE